MSKLKSNPEVPLTSEQQQEIGKCLCAFGGTTLSTVYADGMYIGYVADNVLEQTKAGKFHLGTSCGAVRNKLSPKICDILLRAEHVMALLQPIYKPGVMEQTEEMEPEPGPEDETSGDDVERMEIVALAVKDLSRRDAKYVEKVAHNTGCSLRPDYIEICGDEWVFFESE